LKCRTLRWADHVARMEEDRRAFKIITVPPTRKIPSGRDGRRWEDTIRMNVKEIGITTRNCVDSAQNKDYWRAVVDYYYRVCCLLQVFGLLENNFLSLPFIRLINCRFHLHLQLPPLGKCVFSCFSYHQGAVSFFFLLLSLPSSVNQSVHPYLVAVLEF
jgi:hypothetical protein